MKHVISNTIALALISHAAAAPAQSIERRFRLSVDSTLFSAESGTLSTKEGDEKTTMSFTTIGPASAGLGIGAGVGLTDSLLLTARIGYASSTRTVEMAGDETIPSATSKATANTFSLYPQLSYVFAPGMAFRPYAGVVFGVDSTHTKSSDVEDETSSIAFGLAFGAHWFATESFSVDPSLSVLKTLGSESVASTEFDRNGFVVAGSVALSGWFGGDVKSPGPSVDKAPSRSEARTAPPAHTGSETITDTLEAKVPLAGDGDLRLSGDPIFDPEHVAVTLTIRDDVETFTQCRDIRVESTTRTAKLERIARQFAMGNRVSLLIRGRVSVADLVRVLDAEDARLGLCENELKIGAAEQATLAAFVARFAERLPQTDVFRVGETTKTEARAKGTESD